MSLSSDRDAYESFVENEMEQKPGFMSISNDDNDDEGPMEKLQVEDDIDIDEDEVVRLVKREGHESPVYFEEALGTCEEVTVDYNDSSMSIPLSPPISPRSPQPRFKVKRERPEANVEEKLSMHLDHATEKGYYAKEREEVRETIDEDEETIATFVTAAGQQLALYAVEDSEDVFAVAVYDESGEPPTNFQFLMKSDVERLIGEGAVRTVKKPSQIKRQLLTTQPPVFPSKKRRAPAGESPPTDAKSRQKTTVQRAWSNNAIINQSCQAILDADAAAKENQSSQKQPKGVAYLMMNDSTVGLVGQSENSQESVGSENEIVEQSTVQYILLGGDQSDSELTFDEIQATLQGLNFSTNKSKKKKTLNRKNVSEADKDNTHEEPTDKTEALTIEIQNSAATLSHDTPLEIPKFKNETNSNVSNVDQVDSSTAQSVSRSSSQPRREETENESDKSVEHISVESVDPKMKENGTDGKQCSVNNLKPNTSVEHIESRPKIKRSRKQQLTSVNRGDSEIIIQPASMGAEEDTSNKKRGRRKKKPATDPDYNPRPVRSKKSKKAVRNPRVEIIDIDMDEEEEDDLQRRKDVIEITLDDGKEKCSSDKENEIIMVGDSDDECEETPVKPMPPVMQCEHCARNFRQKRALDTHSRVCPKLRGSVEKASTRALETSSGPSSKDNLVNNSGGGKEYTCKVCNEKFNAVVALARHARTEHQKKYKSKGKPVVEEAETETVEATIVPVERTAEGRRVTRVSQKKKGQSSNQTWKTKKLNCDDCGRWFPSTAILAAHCLQHATRNSENKIRQCHVCKKLIKTRSLYIQHMKTHGRSTRNTKSTSTVLQKKLRQTRQVSSKLTSVKKRGRPRKL